MAFSRTEFLPEVSGSALGLSDFFELLRLERRAMFLALAGDPDLNSGVTGKSVLDKLGETLKWALR